MKKKNESVTNGGQRAHCLSGGTPEDGKQLLRRVEPVKWKRLRNSDIRVVKVQDFSHLSLLAPLCDPSPVQ